MVHMIGVISGEISQEYLYGGKNAKNMKMLSLSIDTLIWRYYLMMLIVIVAGFSGLWLLSILALPVLFSCLMGLEFGKRVAVPQIRSQSARIKSSPQQAAQR
jgi:hypothetical protein